MAPTGCRCRIDSRKLHKPDAGEWHFSLRRVKKASDMYRFDGRADSPVSRVSSQPADHEKQ
jgi:hypothetical protein